MVKRFRQPRQAGTDRLERARANMEKVMLGTKEAQEAIRQAELRELREKDAKDTPVSR